MLSVHDEAIAYQAYLEGHRADPDDEQLWEDLQKARAALEIAWLLTHPAIIESHPVAGQLAPIDTCPGPGMPKDDRP